MHLFSRWLFVTEEDIKSLPCFQVCSIISSSVVFLVEVAISKWVTSGYVLSLMGKIKKQSLKETGHMGPKSPKVYI